MAVKIRLRRIGKNPKGRPHFRVSVFEETRGRDGRIIEELGFYCPTSGLTKLNKEKIEKWIKCGAQISPTVESLLKKHKKGA